MNPENPAISIGADGIDAGAVVAQIQAEVARKRAAGAYDEARVARAERNNLLTLKDDASFMEQYLLCLRQIVAVDINDFEIIEKRGRFAPALVRLKKTIWKLLKFYTYRLWSQQNQVNGLVVTALEGMEDQTASKLAALEQRIAELEAQTRPHGS